MTAPDGIDLASDGEAAGSERGSVGLRTLILIRWIAVIGQAAALLIVHFALGFALPLGIALSVIGVSALINVANSFQHPGRVRLGDRDAMMYLIYDVVQLAALLYLTGGLQNPFTMLILAPMTVGASILSRRSTAALAVVTIGAISVLTIWHLPLPWDEDRLQLPALFIAALWLAMTVSIVFIAAYAFSVTEEGRRMSDALTATQLALAREQRVSAVGALAAAAAHELGSPLATIAIVAKELARDLPPDSPYAEDVQLLVSQTVRCRTILAELAHEREADGGEPYARLPVSALVEAAGQPYHRADVETIYETDGSPDDQPAIARSPEIMHGLGNIIQNAVQFAKERVEVTTSWDQNNVSVEVADDGPGFPTGFLSRLGEPYLSGRGDRGGHMGLGIFIAETLLRRTGASLVFANALDGGAFVQVIWRRRTRNAEAGLAGGPLKLEDRPSA